MDQAAVLWLVVKRHAIEIIVEGRAEVRDPEDKDGNLPALEDPRREKSEGRPAASSVEASSQ